MTDAPGPSKQGGAAVPPAGASALPPQLQAANASKDDRTWGMIAHLSALAGFVVPFGSVIGPLVVFLIKKDQSPFVAFHAKQCLWLQIFAVIVAVVFIVLGLVICVTLPLGILVALAAIVYAIYGAIQVSSGKDFQYYWVGEWVRKQG